MGVRVAQVKRSCSTQTRLRPKPPSMRRRSRLLRSSPTALFSCLSRLFTRKVLGDWSYRRFRPRGRVRQRRRRPPGTGLSSAMRTPSPGTPRRKSHRARAEIRLTTADRNPKCRVGLGDARERSQTCPTCCPCPRFPRKTGVLAKCAFRSRIGGRPRAGAVANEALAWS